MSTEQKITEQTEKVQFFTEDVHKALADTQHSDFYKDLESALEQWEKASRPRQAVNIFNKVVGQWNSVISIAEQDVMTLRENGHVDEATAMDKSLTELDKFIGEDMVAKLDSLTKPVQKSRRRGRRVRGSRNNRRTRQED